MNYKEKKMFDRMEEPQVERWQVENQVHYLSLNVYYLDKVVSELIDRLSPVLNPYISDEASEEPALKVVAPLADDLRAQRLYIESITGALQDILDRLEV